MPARSEARCEDQNVSQSLLARAVQGEQEAFRELTDPYRRELQFHCYRILGSMHDAEDALQETLVSAWRGLARFEQRSSLRAWLYRIATNRCLDALRDAGRRRPPDPEPSYALPAATRMAEVSWLEPYPDALLEGIIDTTPGPEARYETRETIELAFIAALQALPPRPDCGGERELVRRFADAGVADDIDSVVALLADNAWFSMPPSPLEYQGHTAIAACLRAITSRRGERRYTLIPTRANTQPAFGRYRHDEDAPNAHAVGLLVLTIDGERISAVTSFTDSGVLPYFGLPRTLRL